MSGTLLDSFDTIDDVYELGWHADGERLYALMFNLIVIWDTTTGQKLQYITQGTMVDVRWSPDGNNLAVGSVPDNVDILDTTAYNEQAEYTIPTSNLNIAISWSPDGNYLAVGDSTGSIRRFDTRTGADSGELFDVNSYVQDIAYSPEGSRIAVAGSDGTVTVIDARTGDVLETIPASTEPIQAVAWKPDGSQITYGGADTPAPVLPAPFPNRAPYVEAGDDITRPVSEGGFSVQVTLDGSASYDVDGTITDYRWTNSAGYQVGSGKTITLQLTRQATTYTATFTLTTTDDDGAQSSDSINVTVEGINQPCLNNCGPVQPQGQ
jgi:dipeptidyl aminopeptidase/acylaminoacyl peptidase